MDYSPRLNLEIKQLTGNGAAIITRGNEITGLGTIMIDAAARLATLIDGTDCQQGQAVDKLRESARVGKDELLLAGLMYRPTGPVLVTYGEAVEDLQPKILAHHGECLSLWEDVVAARSTLEDAESVPSNPFIGPPSPGGGQGCDPAAQAEQERLDAITAAEGAVDQAYEAWSIEALAWEEDFCIWEDAFDAAVSGITDATERGIEDSFWDDLGGVFDVVLQILSVLGLILAIAGLIIGGPIIAALAAAVAIATLALTAYQFFVTRRADGWDLAFAVIGVIPFGSLGKLGKGGEGFASFALDFLGEGGGIFTAAGRSSIAANAGLLRNADVFGWAVETASRHGITNATDAISRIFSGQNAEALTAPGANPGTILGAVWGDGFAKGFGNVYGAAQLPGDLAEFLELGANMFTTHQPDSVSDYFFDHR